MRFKMTETEEKMRKNFYRQAQKGICIATLSATVLTSIPTVSYAEAYAKGRAVMEEMQKLSLPTENAVTFNLADAALRQEKTFVDAYGEDSVSYTHLTLPTIA